MEFSLLLLVITLGFLILSLLSSSSLLFNKLHIKLRNFALYSSPRIGCLIAFYKNRRRLLDWENPLLNCWGIFNVDGEMWSIQRKLASHVISAKSLREFVAEVLEDEAESRLIPMLDGAAENDRIIDMQEVLRRLAGPFSAHAAAFDAASEISAMWGAAPVFAVSRLKRALNVGLKKELKEAVKLVRGSVDEMIWSKEESMDSDSSNDLLSKVLEAGLDGELVRNMVISFLMAGSDSTSAAVTWLFWLLTGHRKIGKQVVDEVTSIKNSEQLGFDDLKGMNFMKACLCESMRLYPPVVWDSKHAAADDVLPDGISGLQRKPGHLFPARNSKDGEIQIGGREEMVHPWAVAKAVAKEQSDFAIVIAHL
ncbi:UNVERIFIED_CONTAM: cytochrome [Sesamum angustifolium]|uniref:Cytochrome n=1 Tax=Sesamum angustifolium TaxID=2727405 RepID=A0AAW2RL99_9LAMI